MESLKSLFVTLLLLAGAFLAYDYYLALPADKMVFKVSGGMTENVATAADVLPVEDVVDSPEMPAPTPVAAPVVSVNAAPAPAPVPSDMGKQVDSFTPPTIPDIERATAQWTMIPASAFPRIARLSKPITFKTSFGATEVPAGSEVAVVAAQAGVLTVAPNPQSAMRATVPLDATDLKTTLTGLYEAWRAKRIEAARYAWEQREKAPVVTTAASTMADGKPVLGTDGSYPLLMESMKTGQVTEITPTSITRWGSPESGSLNGKPCWIVPVEYDAQTAFGKMSTQAVAKVVDGKVAGWFYKGSGEPVP